VLNIAQYNYIQFNYITINISFLDTMLQPIENYIEFAIIYDIIKKSKVSFKKKENKIFVFVSKCFFQLFQSSFEIKTVPKKISLLYLLKNRI